MDDVLRQREWTEDELRAAGFRLYQRKKQLVMARALTADEAPLTLQLGPDTVVATPGYMLCYNPAQGIRPTLADYDRWPVEPSIFAATYAPWDVPDWQPTAEEQHLLDLGCRPYYKWTGVWARRLAEPLRLQSRESAEPVTVPPSMWIAVGAEGEPWSISDATFRDRYLLTDPDA
jgi:hypothetical protein